MDLWLEVLIATAGVAMVFFAFAGLFHTRPFWTGPRFLPTGPAEGEGGFEGVVIDAEPKLRSPLTDGECVAWWLWERGGEDDPPWVPRIGNWTGHVDIRLPSGAIVRVRIEGGLAVEGGRRTKGVLGEPGTAACALAKQGATREPPIPTREEIIPLDEPIFLAGNFAKLSADARDPMRTEDRDELWRLSNFTGGRYASAHLGQHRDFRWGGPMWRSRQRAPIVIAVSAAALYLIFVFGRMLGWG